MNLNKYMNKLELQLNKAFKKLTKNDSEKHYRLTHCEKCGASTSNIKNHLKYGHCDELF